MKIKCLVFLAMQELLKHRAELQTYPCDNAKPLTPLYTENPYLRYLDLDRGLCAYVILCVRYQIPTLEDESIQEEVLSVLRPIFRAWPSYSGIEDYPVPAVHKDFKDGRFGSPPEANYVEYYHGCKNMYKPDAYGTLRWDLITFIADTLVVDPEAQRPVYP